MKMYNVNGRRLEQGWPNYGSQAACNSSNLCMRLFELSEKLYICFLFFISIAKRRILLSGTVVTSIPYSITSASRCKKNYVREM